MTSIYRIVGFLNERIPQLPQDAIEFGIILRRNLNPSKNLADI